MSGGSKRTTVASWALLAALASSPALAVEGLVTDEEGRPLVGARVCHFQEETGVEMYCVDTDAEGKFSMMDSTRLVLRVVADHHRMREVRASGYHTVKLQPCPTLNVRLVDAETHEPLEEGEVDVVYAPDKKTGPFPVNRNGVQIQRILEAGEVKLVGKAPGYEESERAVTLVDGRAVDAVIELRTTPDGP